MVLHSMPRLPSHHRDSLGRLVLIGLTFEETEEFERLDATPALDKDGCLFPWPTDGTSVAGIVRETSRCIPTARSNRATYFKT
jgi:hypothetical protein